MDKIIKHKDSIRLIASAISLISLLAYTFWHTGGLLASYVAPGWIGYIAAIGIELSVVSLSLRIGELKRSGLSAKWFYSVLVAVVIVSAAANMSEGHRTFTDSPLTWYTIQQLDIVQGFIGLVATALISLIVFSLSEIIGDDVNGTIKVMEKRMAHERKEQSITEQNGAFPYPVEQARTAKAEQDELSKEQRLDVIVDALANEPDIARTELANLAGVKRTTLYNYLNELEETGRIERNGSGLRVTES